MHARDTFTQYSRRHKSAVEETINTMSTLNSSDPTEQAEAAAHDGRAGGNKTKSDKQHDGTATAKECYPRRRKRSGDKHKKNRRSNRSKVTAMERLREERLLQESIQRHTRVFSVSRNPEFFVRVEPKDIRGEEDWPEAAHTVSEEEADAED